MTEDKIGNLDSTLDTLVTDSPYLVGARGSLGRGGDRGPTGPPGRPGPVGVSGSSSENVYLQGVFEEIIKSPARIETDFTDCGLQSVVGPDPSFSRTTAGTFLNSDGVLVGKTTTTTSLNLSTLSVGDTITVTLPARAALDWQLDSTVVIFSDSNADNRVDAGENSLTCILLNYNLSTSVCTLKITSKVGSATLSSGVVAYCGPRLHHSITIAPQKNLLLGSQNFPMWTNNMSPFGSDPTTSSIHNAIPSPHDVHSFNGTKMTEISSSTPGYNIISQECFFESDTTYTFSVYAKYGNLQYLSLYASISDDFEMSASFDLENGEIGSWLSPGATPAIESIADGWYRCSITFKTPSTPPALNVVDIRFHDIDDPDTELTTRDNRYIYIFGAQVEKGSRATEYDRVRIAGYPTFKTNVGLLIEDSCQNLLLNSSAFGSWTLTNTTISSNSIASPDSTVTADYILETTTNGAHSVSSTSTIVAGYDLTYSVFIKPNLTASTARKNIILETSNNSGNAFKAKFDLVYGTVLASTTSGDATFRNATIEYYGNGWYRCSIIGTLGSSDTTCKTSIILTRSEDTTLSPTYAGSNTLGIYAWGAQLEYGGAPTSYIATTSAQATREADNVKFDSSALTNIWNTAEGTMVCEFSSYARNLLSAYQSNAVVFYTGLDALNYISAYLGNDDTVNAIVKTSNIELYNGEKTLLNNSLYRKHCIALTFKAGELSSCYVDGVKSYELTNIVSTVPPISDILLGKYTTSTNYLNGTLRSFRYYPKKFSEDTLEFLSFGHDSWGADPLAEKYSSTVDSILRFSSGDTLNYAVSQAQRDAINRFIVSGKTHGWLRKIKHLYLPIWDHEEANALNMIDCVPGTFTGTLTHAPGYCAGDGSTGRFDYGISPLDVGLSSLDGSLFFLLANTATTLLNMSSNATLMGAADTGPTNALSVYKNGTSLQYTYGGATATTFSYAKGVHLIKRQQYNNVVYQTYGTSGESITSGPSDASTGVPDSTMSVWATNIDGTYSNYGKYALGMHGIGWGLTDEEGSYFVRDAKVLWEVCTGLTL